MKRVPQSRFVVRELRAQDLDNGFLGALGNLSDMGGLTPPRAKRLLAKMRSPHRVILVAVFADGRVAGTTTLLFEQKFIHGGGVVGHIEDVAVGPGFQAQGIGKAMVEEALDRARARGCYKVILDCKPEVAAFYEKLGFRRHEIGMRIDLKPA